MTHHGQSLALCRSSARDFLYCKPDVRHTAQTAVFPDPQFHASGEAMPGILIGSAVVTRATALLEPLARFATAVLRLEVPAPEGEGQPQASASHCRVAEQLVQLEEETGGIGGWLDWDLFGCILPDWSDREALARIEEEKLKIHKDIQANVEKVLMPIVYALLTEVPQPQRKYVELLRDNLMEMSSPFVNQLTEKYRSLTPTEIAICNMIRSGLRSKEIAQMRGVSTATVSRHRERIRRKLAIANTDVNLTTYLQTTM